MLKRLRSDQEGAIADLRQVIGEGEKRVVLQSPTGWGKTLLMADITASARERGRKVIITVPMINLVDPMVDTLLAQGVDGIGVVQANHSLQNYAEPVQVCSVQTLAARGLDAVPEGALVLIDEIHKWFKFFEKWLTAKQWERVPFIGLSASPWTKGLGSYFGRLITANTIGGMITDGTLVPFRTFAPDKPDLSAVRLVAGEYNQDDLYEVMKPAKLVASIVDNWKQLAQDRPTVCFCVNRAHAAQIAAEFDQAGIPSGYMDCETPMRERKAVRKRFLDGDIRVVCNVDVIGLGVDWPEISCVSYCRPTRSDMRFVQNIGRGLRTSPGKQDLLIIDHSDTTLRLGFVTEIYDEHRALDDGKTKLKREIGVALPKLCPNCLYLKAPRVATCPNCGHRVEAHLKSVPVQRGTLKEIKPGDTVEGLRDKLDKHHAYGQLMWIVSRRGYNPGWASHKYKEIYDVWPKDLQWQDKVAPPIYELSEFIYKTQRRWANRQTYAKRKADQIHARGDYTKREKQEMRELEEAASANRFVQGTLCTEQDLKDAIGD